MIYVIAILNEGLQFTNPQNRENTILKDVGYNTDTLRNTIIGNGKDIRKGVETVEDAITAATVDVLARPEHLLAWNEKLLAAEPFERHEADLADAAIVTTQATEPTVTDIKQPHQARGFLHRLEERLEQTGLYRALDYAVNYRWRGRKIEEILDTVLANKHTFTAHGQSQERPLILKMHGSQARLRMRDFGQFESAVVETAKMARLQLPEPHDQFDYTVSVIKPGTHETTIETSLMKRQGNRRARVVSKASVAVQESTPVAA